MEKLLLLREKYKTLFEVELKNIYFSQIDKDKLIVFVEHCIESLSFLYFMWFTHEGIDRKLYKGMTKRSVWFFIHGVILLMFVDKKWQTELASNVSEIITAYIVSQAMDLFGIRAGVVIVH